MNIIPPEEDKSILEEAGQALFRLGRLFSRYPIHRVLSRQTGQAIEISHILVAQAVAEQEAEAEQEVTVGGVAEWLAIDPSTASRLVAETVQAGYLLRTASEADGRRLRLTLTNLGRDLVKNAHQYQRTVFEQVTQDWPEPKRQEFARLFIKFAGTITNLYHSLK